VAYYWFIYIGKISSYWLVLLYISTYLVVCWLFWLPFLFWNYIYIYIYNAPFSHFHCEDFFDLIGSLKCQPWNSYRWFHEQWLNNFTGSLTVHFGISQYIFVVLTTYNAIFENPNSKTLHTLHCGNWSIMRYIMDTLQPSSFISSVIFVLFYIVEVE